MDLCHSVSCLMAIKVSRDATTCTALVSRILLATTDTHNSHSFSQPDCLLIAILCCSFFLLHHSLVWPPHLTPPLFTQTHTQTHARTPLPYALKQDINSRPCVHPLNNSWPLGGMRAEATTIKIEAFGLFLSQPRMFDGLQLNWREKGGINVYKH